MLIVPAASLAFVGLVQGAGDLGELREPRRDLPGRVQGLRRRRALANVASGLFQGMPVGGSVSASALNKAAGARSRWAPLVASVVMAVVIVVFGDAVGRRRHACAGRPADPDRLCAPIEPGDLVSVWRTGSCRRPCWRSRSCSRW